MDRIARLLRRKRVWIPLVLYAAWAVFGFFVLPGILRTQIVDGIRDGMKREARLDRVRFNPLILSLTLQGFELKDPDGTPFVAFDRMYVDVQFTSVFRWALTLREFRLDRPRVHVRLLPDGKLNFDDLIPKESGEPPRVVVGRFAVNQGSVQVTNLMAARPEQTTLTPIDLMLQNFTTIPQKEGHYRLVAVDQGQGSWMWEGDLTFKPLHSAGIFEVRDSRLRAFGEILRRRSGFEVADGRFGCQIRYAMDVRGDSLIARVDAPSVRLTGLQVRDPRVNEELLRFDELAISGVALAYPEQSLAIGQVWLSGTRIRAWREPDSTLNWQASLAAAQAETARNGTANGDSARASAASTPADSAAAAWRVTLGELAVRDLGVEFADRTLDPPFEVKLAPVNVSLRDVSNAPGARFSLRTDVTIAEKGRLELSGPVGALPPLADLDVKLSALPLTIFQPYVNPIAKLQVSSGTLGVQGSLHYRDAKPAPDVAFQGRVESYGLLTRDRRDNERFLAWKAFELNGIDASQKKLEIASVRLTEPFSKILIRRDRTTNVQEVLGLPMPDSGGVVTASAVQKPAAQKPSEAIAAVKSTAPPPIPVKVGSIQVVNGSADFSDLSLILPFAARIEQLNGRVSQLSSRSASRADVELDGRLQPSGSVRVSGGVDPWASDTLLDLGVVFRDFSMPALTPYAGQFLGREIDKGRMSLDLGYRLTGRQLSGENKVVLDQFELGEKVESPEATKLPVGLAIAILKDKEGRIDLDVPVEGDLDDPEFRLGKVIWNFIMSLLKKVATAPFALLGSLFGGGGEEEMGQAVFEPGASELSAAEAERLDKLSKALVDRPQLNLDVRGSTDGVLDGAAIRARKFAALAAEKLASDPKKYGTTLGYSQKLLEDLYAERFGKDGLSKLKETHTTTAGALPANDPQYKAGSSRKVVDGAASSTAMQDELTAAQTADDADLLALANARALAVRTRLVAQGIAESRVYLLDPAPGQVVDGRVKMELALRE
jgi:hypothetical protein